MIEILSTLCFAIPLFAFFTGLSLVKKIDYPCENAETKKNDKLEHCQYCGRNNAKLLGNEADGYWIECPQCAASTIVYNNEQEAIRAWNKGAKENEHDGE